MISREKTDDITLVHQCIARDGDAWSEFFRRFQPVITGRINQIFFRHGYKGGTADKQDAFDAVVDHLLYGKGLKGFSKQHSLEAYIRTVTSHAVIDWYRKRNAAKNLHGAPVSFVVEGDCAPCLDRDEFPELKESRFEDIELTEPERLMLCLLLCRTRDIADRDLDAIAAVAGKTRQACETDVANLRESLTERWETNQEKFESLQRLWIQMTVLERRGDKERAERRKSQYDKQLHDYRKKGVEPFPTRKEIADVFNWDINKVDRIYRKLEESLSRQSVMKKSSAGTSAAS